jgi:hypothetical protein
MMLRRRRRRPVRIHWGASLLAAVLWAGAVAAAGEPGQFPPGQETVRSTLPALIGFEVTDVTMPTEAVTGSTTIAFDQANIRPNRAVRISVKADGDLTPQSGGIIPVSNVSWETSGAVNGFGMNGVLSKTNYVQVFEGNIDALSGQVDVVWKLSPTAPGVLAGQRQTTLRWKIETVKP